MCNLRLSPTLHCCVAVLAHSGCPAWMGAGRSSATIACISGVDVRFLHPCLFCKMNQKEHFECTWMSGQAVVKYNDLVLGQGINMGFPNCQGAYYWGPYNIGSRFRV